MTKKKDGFQGLWGGGRKGRGLWRIKGSGVGGGGGGGVVIIPSLIILYS